MKFEKIRSEDPLLIGFSRFLLLESGKLCAILAGFTSRLPVGSKANRKVLKQS